MASLLHRPYLPPAPRDLDAEEHETQPVSAAANAIPEYTDDLIGQILAVSPKEAAFALVSDHGFVTVEKAVHPPVGKVKPFLAIANDPKSEDELERLSGDPVNGIGRRIPPQEWRRFQPDTPGAGSGLPTC